VTNKEHQRNLKRIARAIEANKVLLRNAEMRLKQLSTPIQTDGKGGSTAKSKLK
jgi:hypothetical protein